MEPRLTLGRVIGSRRQEYGLSLGELAQRLHCNKSTIKRIEDGAFAAPSPMLLVEAARVLDLSAMGLFAAAGYATPSDLPPLRDYLRLRYGVESVDVVAAVERLIKERMEG